VALWSEYGRVSVSLEPNFIKDVRLILQPHVCVKKGVYERINA